MTTFNDLRNESDNVFTSIESEEFREYSYVRENEVYTVQIVDPVALSVSFSGGHRILDASGFCHYFPPGWLNITWKAKDNQPHFVK